MKNRQTRLRVGDIVLARGERWRVAAIRSNAVHSSVSLVGLSASNAGEQRTFITPFDVIEAFRRESRLRVVSLARWRRACRSTIGEAMERPSPGALWSAAAARIELHAYQLEPALAVVRGLASRVLIADEVGLGKTIQSGLIVTELVARGAADRVLFVVPAGLRAQWAQELKERFGVDAVVLDTRECRRRAALLPVGVNPWTTVPIAIASIDYIRRPEVLAQVADCQWDVAIVDEAHGVAIARERRSAADAICERAAHVVLLTATPHNGDRTAFQSLCGLGSVDGDRLLIFRRTRKEVAPGRGRRIHRVLVRQSAGELRVFAALAELSGAVAHDGADAAGARLAMSLLHKRAYSSVHSAAETAARRLATFEPDSASQSLTQLALPLTNDDDFDAADAAPTLSDPLLHDQHRERSLLAAVVDAASAARDGDQKLAALRRLLRRLDARRERAIVFTEYRDTLMHIARRLPPQHGIVHGGMSAAERSAVIRRFVHGDTRLLLATDAASEGLNLQASCRVVINLELPWNPVRLEQRIGRVDRIGQTRRVHVFHLIGRDTGETDVGRRILDRVRRSNEDVGANDPLGEADGDWIEPAAPVLRMEAEANEELRRLVAVRAFGIHTDARPCAADTLIAICRRRRARLALRGHAIAVITEWIADESGLPLAFHVRAVRARVPEDGVPRERASRLLRLCERTFRKCAGDSGEWLTRSSSQHRTFWAVRLARLEKIAAAEEKDAAAVQASLFDRRFEREARAGEARRERLRQAADERLATQSRAAALNHQPARPILVLVP